ncbi:purine nucleoside phosphorylase YfiH/LACC1 family protein [Chitinimonas naiadis]
MSTWLANAIRPDWPAPEGVQALVTTRLGGVGIGPYASLNLGRHVGDDVATVTANRSLLRQDLPAEPAWLEQVHGTAVADVGASGSSLQQADAAVSRVPGAVCVVMTADCLPVFFASEDGKAVGVAHAGWRGLNDGVLEATIARMAGAGPLMAWMGPAIGPDAFEVGEEVRAAFLAKDARAEMAFRPGVQAGKWWADIYLLARLRLEAAGLTQIYGGGLCTVTDQTRFFSYRRDKTTGRMASLIWIAP